MNKKLVKAVIGQLGDVLSLEDVYNHGASGGFCGFTYYSDTIDFFRKNKKEIVELAENMANDLGEDVTNMIKGFNCLKDYGLDNSQIGRVLYGRFSDSGDNTGIMNALSWFALEEVARHEMEKVNLGE